MITDRTTHQQLYDRILSRDAGYDDLFFFAVTSTGIYCRPSCPARRPLKKNCRFFTAAYEAEKYGFRACKRCHPNQTKAGTAIQQLYKAQADSLANIGDAKAVIGLGIGERQFRRLVKSNIGKTPAQILQQRRLEHAHDLVQHTDLAIIDIAFRAEFSSVRQFNHAFKGWYGISPRQRRKGKEDPDDALL